MRTSPTTSWAALGSSTTGEVNAFLEYDPGTGPELVVGGSFGAAGGVAATESLATWNGLAWSSVGGGIPGGVVHSLELYDDGSGCFG